MTSVNSHGWWWPERYYRYAACDNVGNTRQTYMCYNGSGWVDVQSPTVCPMYYMYILHRCVLKDKLNVPLSTLHDLMSCYRLTRHLLQ